MALEVVLFDLDGTLSDSARGIVTSLRLAFDELGLPQLDESTERSLLGPPFRDSFPALMPADRVEEAIAAYRRHYTAGGGMLDTSLYDGIADLLTFLRARGLRLAVATSKSEAYAPAIVAHLGIAEAFTVICGDDPEGGRGSKAAVIAEALLRLGSPEPDAVLMLGDRSHDVIGAATHGIATVGAGWGYGAPGELIGAGAVEVFAHPTDLTAYVTARTAA